MKAPGLVIVWRINTHCNLGCPFCGYSRDLRRTRTAANPDQVIAFAALLRDYCAKYAREVLVSWLGGEPLMWPPLMNLSRQFKHGFHLRVGVTTNGTMLNSADMRQHVIADYDEITISIDGIGEFHDRARSAPGLYQELKDAIMSLRELKVRTGSGPLIRVNTLLMRTNIYQLERLCLSLAEWGVEELTFNQLGGVERPAFFADNRLLREHIEWLRHELPGIRERMAGLGLRICGSQRYLERIASTVHGVKIPIFDCKPGQSFLFIDEDGFIGPCSLTTKGYGERLDEVRSSEDLYQLSVRLAARKCEKMLAPCVDCMSTQMFGKFESA
jgi:MoaA/NifB/PqqE/SkfB family radical SAM enzyme